LDNGLYGEGDSLGFLSPYEYSTLLVKISFYPYLNENTISYNMRSSKFNRNRSLDPWQKYLASQNKTRYRIDKGKLRVLSSLHTENQTMGGFTQGLEGISNWIE
jgi:hypothetical protein